ncbi:S41 family peptidase [Flavobacterium humi]|uniref:Peptidase S41 n=1 Tax=Flavobacterium humi TaxID=2562683 RepID=A0A4Z0L9Y3_9FLAO|nr:S41 family peptidase [Flavobacterium humi]TGD58009.1 peptidase S41 [Flavobacterium humi]
MKIYFLLFFSVLIGSQTCLAQEKLTETEKLICTAKIWGFLKYYHPKVANGKYDWDTQLFEILPKIEKAQDKTALSSVFSQWIASLGEISRCNSCGTDSKKEYFTKNFDLNWTQDRNLFSDEVCKKLKDIEENRFQGKQHYVSTINNVGNIQIENEPEYKNFDWNNKNLRILSLFRYWNTIEYFFPYKYQTDQKWDLVLTEMLPKFLHPENKEEYHLCMLELVVKINDSHGFFITPETNDYFGLKWLPADFSIIDDKAIVTKFYNDSLAQKDDLRIGDVITKVDGKPISQILEKNYKYINASNASSKLNNAKYAIFNGSTDTVKIEYIRNGTTESKTVNRYFFKDFKYKFSWGKDKWKILDGNIGYVNMGTVTNKEIPKMMEDLKNTKGTIFDIRNYPNGTLYQIANYINPTKADFYKKIIPDLSYPGKFIWGESGKCGNNRHEKYTGKIIVLVNGQTQSHAEFTTMGFQANKNAMVIGSQTSGADGNISRFELVGGFKTMMSGIGIFYPDGKETQRVGIVPNIEVKPTILGIQKGQDEVLDKAIEVINTKS